MRTFLSILIHRKFESGVSIKGFSNFKCLLVLSLNEFNIEKVPNSIGKLTHRRYLDLSNNWFEVLNLQTLKLVGCRSLKELPKDTRELINMRHLENDRCPHLSHMPCGIGELTVLQSLPLFVVGNVGNERLSELKGLNNLKGELQIEGLENVRVVESREANLGGKQNIQSLTLRWWRLENQSIADADSVLEGFLPHSNLK